MTEDPRHVEPGDRELKRALKAAVTTRLEEVHWDGLYERIMADAEARVGDSQERTFARVAAWWSRGVPAATAALAAAVLALWILPAPPAPEAPPPEFWPVAQELMSNLPEDTHLLLDAGRDVEGMLTALMMYDG